MSPFKRSLAALALLTLVGPALAQDAQDPQAVIRTLNGQITDNNKEITDLKGNLTTVTGERDGLKSSLKIAEDALDSEIKKREATERELKANNALIACIEGKKPFSAGCYLAIVKDWRDTKAAEIAYERAGKAVEPITLTRPAPIAYDNPAPIGETPTRTSTPTCNTPGCISLRKVARPGTSGTVRARAPSNRPGDVNLTINNFGGNGG